MARSTAAFERVINLAVARVKPPEFQKLHARIARRALADHLAKLDHKPNVVRFVDGRRGLPEEQVQPYGVIRYEFQRLAEIALFALNRARALSPARSGRYRESWFIMAGGAEVAPAAIPEGVPLILTNDQPYHRKLEMTVNRGVLQRRSVRLPPGIVERVRQDIFREFGEVVDAQISFIELRGGYILKGRARRRRAAQDRRSSAFRAGREFLAARSDTSAGRPMTYPALIIRPL